MAILEVFKTVFTFSSWVIVFGYFPPLKLYMKGYERPWPSGTDLFIGLNRRKTFVSRSRTSSWGFLCRCFTFQISLPSLQNHIQMLSSAPRPASCVQFPPSTGTWHFPLENIIKQKKLCAAISFHKSCSAASRTVALRVHSQRFNGRSVTASGCKSTWTATGELSSSTWPSVDLCLNIMY